MERGKKMLKDKKYFLFDIDGTLAVDDGIFAGSRELISYIDRIGGRSFYITNNSTKSRKDYVEKFRRWGICTDETQFMTASYAACQHLKRSYGEKKLFVVGTPSFVEELKDAGLTVTEQAEEDVSCVVVGFDRTLTYEKVEAACELLFRSGMDYVATNPDLRCPVSYGFVPDCGGICEMLKAATGREPYYTGKPDAGIVGMCLGQVDGKKEEALVVGDRLYTDIACGIRAGVETALVYTGEAKKEDLKETNLLPDYVYEDIQGLYEAFVKSRQDREGDWK